MNKTILTGRLTRDPEIKTNGNMRFANFTLAVDKNLSKEKKEEFDKANKATVDFIRVVAFNGMTNTVSYLNKGRKVLVVGSIATGNYINKEGQKVNTFEVVAESIEFLDYKNSQPNQNQQMKNQNQNPSFNQYNGQQMQNQNQNPSFNQYNGQQMQNQNQNPSFNQYNGQQMQNNPAYIQNQGYAQQMNAPVQQPMQNQNQMDIDKMMSDIDEYFNL